MMQIKSFQVKDKVQVVHTASARNILFVNERLVAGQMQQLCSDYILVIQIYDTLNEVLRKNSNQSDLNENDLVTNFKRCNNKIDDWISFVSEHKNRVIWFNSDRQLWVNDLKAVISDRVAENAKFLPRHGAAGSPIVTVAFSVLKAG